MCVLVMIGRVLKRTIEGYEGSESFRCRCEMIGFEIVGVDMEIFCLCGSEIGGLI